MNKINIYDNFKNNKIRKKKYKTYIKMKQIQFNNKLRIYLKK
jgi:hypothetical protein